jgi:hypothetical protein
MAELLTLSLRETASAGSHRNGIAHIVEEDSFKAYHSEFDIKQTIVDCGIYARSSHECLF